MHKELTGAEVAGPRQYTRVGVPGKKPAGSGFDNPIRVQELEAEYYKNKK